MRFTLTDESLDADRERVLIDGAILNRFLKNPVMLWRHWGDPIGRWKDVRIEENPKRITAEPEFYEKDPFAKKIAGMVQEGFLKACSIGFIALEKNSEPAMMLAGQKYPTITKFELLECSIVPIGSNENALIDEMEKEFCLRKETTSPEITFGASIENQIIVKQQFKPTKNMVEIAKTLGLPENATEAQINEAIAKLQKSTVNAVIEFGKSKGVINTENEAEFMTLAGVDLEATRRLIEKTATTLETQKTVTDTLLQTQATPKRELLVDKLKEVQKTFQTAQNDIATPNVSLKTWADYEKNAPEQLLEMIEKDTDKADALASAYLKEALGI